MSKNNLSDKPPDLPTVYGHLIENQDSISQIGLLDFGIRLKGDNLLTSSLITMELVIFLTFIISILLFGAWAGKITLPLIPSLLQASENDRP